MRRCRCMHSSLGTCNIQIIQYWRVTVTLRLTVHTRLHEQPWRGSQKNLGLNMRSSNSTRLLSSLSLGVETLVLNMIRYFWFSQLMLNKWKVLTDSYASQKSSVNDHNSVFCYKERAILTQGNKLNRFHIILSWQTACFCNAKAHQEVEHWSSSLATKHRDVLLLRSNF